MNVPEPEELAESSDDDKKFNRDSYLRPTFFSHANHASHAELYLEAAVHVKNRITPSSELSRVLGLKGAIGATSEKTLGLELGFVVMTLPTGQGLIIKS